MRAGRAEPAHGRCGNCRAALMTPRRGGDLHRRCVGGVRVRRVASSGASVSRCRRSRSRSCSGTRWPSGSRPRRSCFSAWRWRWRRSAAGSRPAGAAAGSRGCSRWRSARGSAASTCCMPARISTFDRAHGLRSIPGALRRRRARCASRAACTSSPSSCLLALGPVAAARRVYLAGVAVVAALLVYEQSLVSDERSVAGQARVRSERLRRHPVSRSTAAAIYVH